MGGECEIDFYIQKLVNGSLGVLDSDMSGTLSGRTLGISPTTKNPTRLRSWGKSGSAVARPSLDTLGFKLKFRVYYFNNFIIYKLSFY